ncbi:MAG: cytochrome c oxidase subunit 4, partial [Rhodoglobus sp.]|nr:cytochrome c oxidase subunit 4 [Rhodoglobus sp.]
MGANSRLFWILTVFFFFASALYVVWSLLDQSHRQIEWVGAIALALCGLFFGLVAFYLRLVHRAQKGELPEDRIDANIEDGDAEQGHFSPWSWWPIVLATAAALTVLGLAIGVWIAFIGVSLLV